MNATDHALALLWVGVGIIAGFFIWAYVAPMLPAQTTA